MGFTLPSIPGLPGTRPPSAGDVADVAGDVLGKRNLLEGAMGTLRLALQTISHDNLRIDPSKESPVIKFLEKALGLPDSGKPSQELLDALKIKDIKELNGSKIAEVVKKLQEEGKIGPAIYDAGGDPSFIQALKLAMDAVKPNMVNGIAFNPARSGLNGVMPEAAPAAGPQPAVTAPSAAATPTTAPSAPVAATSTAPAAPVAPSGPAVLTSNKVNEVVNDIRGVLPSVKNDEMKIVLGQPSRVIAFLEQALNVTNPDGKPGQSSPQLEAALGIGSIRDLTGAKLAEVVEKLQAEGRFAQGADPALARAFQQAVQDIRPGFTNPVAAGQMGLYRNNLDDALKKNVGQKVSIDMGADTTVYAAAPGFEDFDPATYVPYGEEKPPAPAAQVAAAASVVPQQGGPATALPGMKA